MFAMRMSIETHARLEAAEAEAGELADARHALRAAVCDVERARAAGACATQHPYRFASESWALVEVFDVEGTRYVVAREHRAVPSQRSSLTPAEQRVLAQAAHGLSTKEIAHALCIKDSTVRVLLMRAARRYGARDRDELLRLVRGEPSTGP